MADIINVERIRNMSLELIRKLRVETNAGMSDCKKALEESAGDYDKAVDWLKAKSLIIAASKQDQEQKEGVVFVAFAQNKVVLGKCLCQTDFCARSEVFQAFVTDMSNAAIFSAIYGRDLNIVEAEQKATLSLREKISFGGYKTLTQSVDSQIFAYEHSNHKLGALVQLKMDSKVAGSKEINELGEHLAMQVVASNPIAISASDVSKDMVERQEAIFKQQIEEMPKKPAPQFVDKILKGKTEKWLKEVTLLEQECVWLPKVSIREVLTQMETKLNAKLEIVAFLREEI